MTTVPNLPDLTRALATDSFKRADEWRSRANLFDQLADGESVLTTRRIYEAHARKCKAIASRIEQLAVWVEGVAL
jgi:hypothetical protein